MIIEFCGVPGGGKSTLAKAYAATKEATLVSLDMYNRLPTLLYALVFAIFHPVSFFWLTVFVLRYHVRGLFWYSFHLMLRACAKHMLAKCVRGTALIDEGLLHLLCIIPLAPLSEKIMRRIIRVMPRPDVVVLAPTGVFHRFHNREAHKHPRVQQGEEILAAWEGTVRANTMLLACMLAKMDTPIYLIPERTQEDAIPLGAFVRALRCSP